MECLECGQTYSTDSMATAKQCSKCARIETLEAENAALREALGDIAAGRTQGLPASVVAALAANSHRTLEAEYSDWLARQTEGEG